MKESEPINPLPFAFLVRLFACFTLFERERERERERGGGGREGVAGGGTERDGMGGGGLEREREGERGGEEGGRESLGVELEEMG